MLFLYRFFCGALRVEFFGVYPEKVLNLCAKNKITIWSARYVNQKICCKITVKDFLKLPNILRKSGIRVHILERFGFPFIIKKYNRRFGILVGAVIFFGFLYIMSGYVWIINVEGNNSVETKAIIAACEDLGVKIGVKKSSINAKADAQELLLKMDTLAWSSFNIEGCRVTVNVTEVKPKAEDNSIPTNLISDCDGVITHIDVTAGNCLVKVGDVVKRGDLLVSGVVETESETRFVHSMGEITAITERAITFDEALEAEALIPTGKVKTKSVLQFFTFKIPLFLGKETERYTSKTTVKTAKLFSENLPIKLYTKRYVLVRNETVTLTYEQAVKKLEERLLKECGGTVKNKEFSQIGNKVILNAVLSEKKNIAVSERLNVE